MNNKIITLESKKYALQLDNFEGPLDLLCYLIDKNKMDIYKVNIDEIANQYIDYIKEQEDLEVTSEFLIMASTLLLIKSKGLLPKETEDEAELSEEELIRRIVEYKKYKEISKFFKTQIQIFSNRIFKNEEKIEVPNVQIEKVFSKNVISDKYKNLLKIQEEKININAKNIEKIAIHDKFTVTDKVKDIFRILIKNKKFVFGKVFSLKKKPKEEVVTAFSGVLELSRRDKVFTSQEELFGDITIYKKNKDK